MRWVNFLNGIKSRLNEMLGTSDNSGSDNDLTYWSLQSAMLTNLRRIVSSCVGDASNGRVMKGLSISVKNLNQITILPGFGFTSNGDIVVIEESIDVSIDFGIGDPVFIALKHENTEITDVTKGGKQVNLTGRDSRWIVNDDKAASEGGASVVEVLASEPSDGDYVTIGSIANNGSDHVELSFITESIHRGLAPNSLNNQFVVPNIDVQSKGYIRSILYLLSVEGIDGANISIDSAVDFSEDVSFSKKSDMSSSSEVSIPALAGTLKVGTTPAIDAVISSASTVSLTIKNGIITAASAS